MGTGKLYPSKLYPSSKFRTPSVFQQLRIDLPYSRFFHTLKEPICADTEHTVQWRNLENEDFFPLLSTSTLLLRHVEIVWFEGCTLISDHNLAGRSWEIISVVCDFTYRKISYRSLTNWKCPVTLELSQGQCQYKAETNISEKTLPWPVMTSVHLLLIFLWLQTQYLQACMKSFEFKIVTHPPTDHCNISTIIQ